eukprot:3383202-Alexandrium_andersonii.AAC.1
MSASLVGSEMCIRDRAATAQPAASPGAKFASQVVLARSGKSPCSERAGAVSYTHLTLPTICSV